MIAMANITMIIPPISVRTVETGDVMIAEAGTNVSANPAKIAARYKPTSLSHTKNPSFHYIICRRRRDCFLHLY